MYILYVYTLLHTVGVHEKVAFLVFFPRAIRPEAFANVLRSDGAPVNVEEPGTWRNLHVVSMYI